MHLNPKMAQFVLHRGQRDFCNIIQALKLRLRLVEGGEIDQAANDRIGPLNGAGHLGQHLARIGVVARAEIGEEIDAQADGLQGIHDLVSHAGGKRADRLQLFGLDQLRLRHLELVVRTIEVSQGLVQPLDG